VAARRREREDVWTLDLAPEGDVGRGAPGQFNMLYAHGAGEAPISLSGDPRQGALRHTIRAVGGVTRALCETAVGDRVGVRGPFGKGWPLRQADGRDLWLVAGGIGLAPLRPVVQAALASPRRFGRVRLFYGARASPSLLFPSELRRWGRSLAVRLVVEQATSGWSGPVGRVTDLLEVAGDELREASIFVCGPEPMMRATARLLLGLGASPARTHLSLERHMECGAGRCGRCRLGPYLLCRDGPVMSAAEAGPWMGLKEVSHV
jgi:NAD(P)H-flavin reductase